MWSWSWTCCVLISVFVALQTHHQVQGTLTRAEKHAVLKAHNDARRDVHPRPCSPLPKLTWDATLAKVAQNFADKCVYGHNHRKTAQAGGAFVFVGENLYITTLTSEDPSLAVISWEREKADYTYHDDKCNRLGVCGKCTRDQQCGHYTQLVWNMTTKVGCGIRKCPAGWTTNYPFSSSLHPYATIFVCNYGPGGNYAGRHPYAVCPATPAVLGGAAAAGTVAKSGASKTAVQGNLVSPLLSTNNNAAAPAVQAAIKSGAVTVQMNTAVSVAITATLALLITKLMLP